MNTPTPNTGTGRPEGTTNDRDLRTPLVPEHDLSEEQEGHLAADEESLREAAERTRLEEPSLPITREEGMDRRD